MTTYQIPTGLAGAAMVTGFLFAGYPAVAKADQWELRTATTEVPGTREIEAGDLEKGIRVSQFAFTSIPYNRKPDILTNLCVAYILKRDAENATQYCDQAVERGGGNTAYNNRGVLRALQGDYQKALEDFRHAARLACKDGCDMSVKDQRDTPTHVAKRNLGRAETKYAAIVRQEDSAMAARADQ